MARFNSLLILLLVAFLTIADAGVKVPSSQFSKASASAGSFGRPAAPVFAPKPQNQFGARPPVPGPPGPPGPPSVFGKPSSGSSINIAKSISISTGGSGGSKASAKASAFGK